MYSTAQSAQSAQSSLDSTTKSGLGSHMSHASFNPSSQASPDQLDGFGPAITPRPASTHDEAYHPTQHNPRPRKKKAVAPERSKTTRACDVCKIKKARCSGTIPCARCTKHSIQCNYNSSYGRGSPPPPLPALVSQNSNVPSIENNVSDFPKEQRVTFEEPYHPSSSVQREQTPIEIGYHSQAVYSRNSPERGGTDPEGYYLGPTSGITFLNRAWRRLNQEHVTTTDLQHSDAHRDVSIFAFGDKPIADFDKDKCQLPSRKRAAEMISKYFDHAVVTYRFLHRQVVDEWCSTLYGMKISPAKPPPRAFVSKTAVIFMIFALVTLHEEHNDENIEGESGNITSGQWFGAAQYVMRYETGRPSLEIIQARLIQCLYLISSSRANQCWYTLGTTIHLLIALGLHRKKPHGSARRAGSFLEHECQKRVFWCAYTLDIYFSLMLGRPRTFHSEDVDQEFPEELNDSEITNDGPQPRRNRGDCTHTASILHFKLSKIVGEVSRRVYTIQAVPETIRLEEAERLARELEAWKQEVPPLFSTIQPSSLVPPLGRQSNVLQIAYDHAVIHANRSFLLTNFTDLSKRPDISDEKLQRQVSACVEAATRIVQTVNDLSDDASLSTAFWFTHYCAFCGVFVLYLHIIRQGKLPFEQSTSGLSDLLESVERCQRNLAHATRQNSPSRRYNIILEELRLEVHRQLHSATSGSMPLTQTTPIAIPDGESFSMLSSGSEFSSMIEGHFRGPQATFNQNLATDWESLSWPQLDSWAYMSMPDLQTPL